MRWNYRLTVAKLQENLSLNREFVLGSSREKRNYIITTIRIGLEVYSQFV